MPGLISGLSRSLADPVPAATAVDWRSRWFVWVSFGLPFLLLFILYAPVLKGMAWEWATLPEVRHGPLVPVVGSFIAWRKRHELAKLPHNSSYLVGASLLWCSFTLLVLGTLGADYFLPRLSLLIALAGVLSTLGGTAVLRDLGFPLFLLVFMIRVPMFIYSRLIFQLQMLAAAVAEAALAVAGIPVVRQGNLLDVGTQQLQASQASGGLNSLLTMVFVALAYSYFFSRKRWISYVAVASVLPVALLAGVARITVTGILAEYGSDAAQGFYSFFDGWVMLLACAGAVVALHAALNAVSGFSYARKHRR